MPLHEYRCHKCGHQFERISKFSDSPVRKCPECGGKVEQLLSAPAVHFKGSGFYITDYAKKSSAETSNDGGSATVKADDKKASGETAGDKASGEKASGEKAFGEKASGEKSGSETKGSDKKGGTSSSDGKSGGEKTTARQSGDRVSTTGSKKARR